MLASLADVEAGPRVGSFDVGKPREIVHAGVERKRNTLALFECVEPFFVFDLGIVTLIYAGHHLHLNLSNISLSSQFFES